MSGSISPIGSSEKDLFREAMASFPSGVTIVTTADETGRWWGFTATSFCSVSMEPPLVLVCLANSAECAPVFQSAERWIVHIIHPEHAELAMRFATRGADKFADSEFIADENGLPVLVLASVILDCDMRARYPGGDHMIMVGEVGNVRLGAEMPTVYFRRAFHSLVNP